MAGKAAAEEEEEELLAEYDEVCDEVAELKAELRAAHIEAQQLRMRLEAASRGAKGAARLRPLSLPAASAPAAEDQRTAELGGLLQWLAEHVDLGRSEALDVGFEVPIGGRTVHLRRVVQWPLASAAGGKLRLSAPVEHQEGVAALLASTKAKGKADPETARSFAASWDLVAGELTTASHAHAEPSVLLAHRGSTQGILVATWPTREALEAFHALHGARGEAPRVGDRVEVEYDGKWYVGILHSVDAAGKASVRCDVDAPGVLTVTPLYCVRRLAVAAGASGSSGSGASAATVAGVEPAAATAATAAAGRPQAASEEATALEPAAAAAGGGARPPWGSHRRSRSSAL